MSESVQLWWTLSLWTAGVWVAVRLVDAATSSVLGPRVRASLYVAVLVRLALPTQWASPVGVVGDWSSGALERGPVEAAAPALAGLTSAQPHGVSLPTDAAGDRAAAPRVPTATTMPDPLLGVYGAGVVLLLGLTVIRRRSQAAIRRASQPAPADVAELAWPTPVLCHPTQGPFVLGTTDPCIVMPRALLDSGSAQQLRCILAHERAHVQARDPWVVMGMNVLTIAAWPIVPVWLAVARVRTLLEHAADLRAWTWLGVAPRQYGHVLISLAAERPRPREFLAPALGAYRSLRGRILSLRRRPPRWPGLQCVSAMGIATAIVACASHEPHRPPPATSPAPSASTPPAQTPAPEAEPEPDIAWTQLRSGAGYSVSRPLVAWGTPATIAALREGLSRYAQEFDGPPIIVRDLSRKGGGRLPPHKSHRDGRDVDLEWAGEDYDNDGEQAWALFRALLSTGAIEAIWVDYALQEALFAVAAADGLSAQELGDVFQYPRGANADTGLIRHQAGHSRMVHVRFRADAP